MKTSRFVKVNGIETVSTKCAENIQKYRMMKFCTGLYIVGHFYNRGGYADMAHQYACACKQRGIPVRLLVTGEELPEVKAEWSSIVESSRTHDLGGNPFALIIDIPPRFRLVDTFGVAKVIGVTIFEGDSIPFEWVNHCGLVDEVWVPTDFNMKTFTTGGPNAINLRKVPLAIDNDFWDANHRKNRLPKHRKPNDTVNLLYVCSLHRRKGLDRLVESYFREFSSKDNVHLTISCFPIRSGGMTDEEIVDDASLERYLKHLGTRLSGRTEMFPKLTAFFRYWSIKDLRRLFFVADAYVSTERADGWALPVMQMMSLGKPTMSLGWGGSTEYTRHNNSYLIEPGPLEPVDPHLSSVTVWYRGQNWPQMTVGNVRRTLRILVSDIQTGESLKSIAESEIVLSNYTYSALGERIALAVGWSKMAVTSETQSEHEVKVRSEPYAGTWVHSMLSKVRLRLCSNPGERIGIVSMSSEECTAIEQLAIRNRIKVVMVGTLDGIGQLGIMDTLILATSEPVDTNRYWEVQCNQMFYYDIVSQSLLLLGQQTIGPRAAVYLSGGLTEGMSKLLAGRGLMHCSLVTHVTPDKHPASWSVFQNRISTLVASALGLTDIFIADEDALLKRQSYQQAELAIEGARIWYVQQPYVSMPLSRLSDDDIYRRSIPKRWCGSNRGALKSAVVVPAISTHRNLVTVLTRLSYFLPANSGIRVTLLVSKYLKKLTADELSALRSEYDIDVYGDYTANDIGHIELVNAEELSRRMAEADALKLVWNLDLLTNYERLMLNLSKNIILLDVDHSAMRSGFAAAYAMYFCQSRATVTELRARSKERLLKLVKRLGSSWHQRVVVFGTGPSLADAFNLDFSGAITIACNTMVKDRRLLEHIQPALIVASDADFHFGPSRYAQQFRTDLVKALQSHDAMFVCPEAHAALLVAHYPDIEPRLIAVPVDGDGKNFDLTMEFRVRAIDNVLLQFLFPLSATLGRKIQLLGFDGRKKDDKKFWNHNVNTQYPELMDTIEASHPAFFFYRSYRDYFARHCQLIQEYINDFEAMGGSVQSLSDSAVPALAQRYCFQK